MSMELKGKHAKRIIQIISIHLLLIAGKINIDEAIGALETDKTSFKVERKSALEFASEVAKPLLRKAKL